VILDRRLGQDDWRGLGEGLVDNVPVSSNFVLLFEKFIELQTVSRPDDCRSRLNVYCGAADYLYKVEFPSA
jgi:hypothetical protein